MLRLIHSVYFEGGLKYEVQQDKCRRWSLNGLSHREDGPAVVYSNGGETWFINGKRHREDGPAVELANGSKAWYSHGQYHREGGPAIEFADGGETWFINGKRHREDGPAVKYIINGVAYYRWFLHDRELSEKAFCKKQGIPYTSKKIQRVVAWFKSIISYV